MAILTGLSITSTSGNFNPTIDSLVQDQAIQTIKSTLPPEIKNHRLAEKLSAALQMGRSAGEKILSVKNASNLQVKIKEDLTPVTTADHASNEMICKTINRLYPNDGILSEETIDGEKVLLDAIKSSVYAEWTWVIDPLDGTKAFLKSVNPNSLVIDSRYQGKNYGVHIGLLCDGKPIMGVNYYPETETLYFSLDGFAYKQVGNAPAQRIFSKSISGIHPILTPTPNERAMVGKIYQKLMGKEAADAFNEHGLFLDSFGYKMASIAEGNGCNLFIAPPGGPGFWDVCSMLPLVQAVGGQVSDWEGNPINFRDLSKQGLVTRGVIVTIDQKLHQQVVDIIAELISEKELAPF